MWFVSSQEKNRFPSVKIPFADKAVHAAEYAVFGLLLTRALSPAVPGLSRKQLFFAVLFLGALWGASDEIHQYFVPTREMDVFDWLMDCAGTALGFFFYEKRYS